VGARGVRSRRFGWAEEQFAVDLVQGSEVGMDVDVGLVEVDVGPVQPGEFAPPQAGVGGGDDQDLVDASGDAGDDVGDLRGAGVGSFDPVSEGDLDAAGRVERDPPVFDRFPQHHGQHHDDVGGRTWRQFCFMSMTRALMCWRRIEVSGR
jgi:hypothetical protein